MRGQGLGEEAEARDGRLQPTLYSAGAFGASVLLQTILLWFVYFYAPPAGVPRLSPVLVGLTLAGGRVVNALTNPPVAYWSDRVRSRWGRRRPFIALGAPLLVACFILLWIPPGAPRGTLFVYALATLSGFFFFFSVVLNPYAALLPDITPRGAARVATASWQAAASLAGVGVAVTLSPWLISHQGFRGMGVVLGTTALALLWGTAFGVREPARAVSTAVSGFAGSMVTVVRNRTFGIYLASVALLWLGTSMVNATIVYVITVLMGLPTTHVGIVLGAAFACTLGAFPLLFAVSKRLGTARVMAWTLGLTSLIVPLVGTIGLPGLPFSPAAQGYVLVVLTAAPLAALLVLPNALLADIADVDRLGTGGGHEAMFYAVQGLVLNVATAVSSVMLGMLLTLGYRPGHALGLRLIPSVAGASTLLALLVFRRFPTPPRDRRDAPSRS